MAPGTTVVIGGGIVGLACAYELASAGHRVHVLERATLGKGSSGGNAGWVTLGHCYPVPSPGAVRAALRSAGHADAPLYVRPSVSPATPAMAVRVPEVLPTGSLRSRGCGAVGPGSADRKLFDDLADDGVDTTLTRPGLVHAFLDQGEAGRTLALQRSLAKGPTRSRTRR